MEQTKKLQLNMTEGRLLGKIVIFILPLIASNLLQVAYNAADMMVVGLSSEKNAVGAIGTTGSFINLTLNILMGCAVGTNIFLARSIGAKNAEEASRTVHTSMCLALILGFVSGAFGFGISRPLLRAIGTEDRLLDLATLYTRIYFLGMPFVSITYYCIAILRANGDTRTPLKVLSMTGVLNVLLN
ncbi:MAG: MATE family efflux transporter, partial [Clostridia bacterium]|nr:MATE family efflux transporter [Clostridia bacterium]